VTGGPAPYTEAYAYDPATGNLIAKGGQSLQYNDPAHAHAVTDMAANNYVYDANACPEPAEGATRPPASSAARPTI